MNKRRLSLVLSLMCAARVYGSNVITDWNTIASTVIVSNAGNSPGASGVWFAYSSLAVYDAVNAITGSYQPFYYRVQGPENASIDAAAAAAAHLVLVNYFPSQKAALDSQYAASLAAITADGESKDAGAAVGEAAAMELDGRRFTSQRYVHSWIGPGRMDPDAARFQPARYPLAGTDAALHHENSGGFSAGSSSFPEQRDLEARLQPHAYVWRRHQLDSIRCRGRDRRLLDRKHRGPICADVEFPGWQL